MKRTRVFGVCQYLSVLLLEVKSAWTVLSLRFAVFDFSEGRQFFQPSAPTSDSASRCWRGPEDTAVAIASLRLFSRWLPRGGKPASGRRLPVFRVGQVVGHRGDGFPQLRHRSAALSTTFSGRKRQCAPSRMSTGQPRIIRAKMVSIHLRVMRRQRIALPGR